MYQHIIEQKIDDLLDIKYAWFILEMDKNGVNEPVQQISLVCLRRLRTFFVGGDEAEEEFDICFIFRLPS